MSAASCAADRVDLPGDAVVRIDALWIVFSPAGVPQPHTCKSTHDEAMQSCFGRRERDRYPSDWWQHNLDEGWTCRKIVLNPPSSAAGAAGLEEIEADLAAIERQVRITCENDRNESAAKRADPVGTMVEISLSHVLDRVQSIRVTIARQADDLERLRGDGWLPIETAPRDGSKFDAWCVHPETGGFGCRLADVQMRGDGSGFGIMLWGLKAQVVWAYLDGRDWRIAPWRIVAWRPLPEPPARAQIARPSADTSGEDHA